MSDSVLDKSPNSRTEVWLINNNILYIHNNKMVIGFRCNDKSLLYYIPRNQQHRNKNVILYIYIVITTIYLWQCSVTQVIVIPMMFLAFLLYMHYEKEKNCNQMRARTWQWACNILFINAPYINYECMWSNQNKVTYPIWTLHVL